MQSILYAAVVLAGEVVSAGLPEPAPTGVDAAAALTARLASEVRTGSLLLSEGDCLAVKTFTCSPYTHVAVVVVRRGEPMVYDTTGGKGVRCLPLGKYSAWLGHHPVTALHPAKPFTEEKAAALEACLDKELGRPYAITHHLTGERCEGLHCAEYATDGLVAAGLIQVRKAPRVSPASLAQGLVENDLYTVGERLVVEVAPTPRSNTGHWCKDCWNDTMTCTKSCWKSMKGMVFCQ